jgi:hypothetical protein
LRRNCGSLYASNTYARFGARRQRLMLYQPSREVLRFLANVEAAYLNLAEVAFDWTFEDPADLDEAVDFVRRHVVKKYHRGTLRWVVGKYQRGKICWYRRLVEARTAGHNSDHDEMTAKIPTRYTNSPQSRTNLLHYHDRPSKVQQAVGKLCLHGEWRTKGRSTLCREGIPSISELLRLDHRAFWQKRLRLYQVDLDKLGRLYSIHFLGQQRRRRGPHIKFYGSLALNVDRAYGSLMVRSCGSVQEALAIYRKHFNIRSCLKEIDISHLLPGKHGTDFFYDYTSKLPKFGITQRHHTTYDHSIRHYDGI